MSHIISPSTSLCIHFAGLGQVSHNKWFVLMTGYLCYSVSVWIFSRFFTWKFGFWEPSQQCLDLSCLPVLICLVSWSGFVLSLGQLKQANFRSSGGQLDKETSNTSTAQLGESLRTTTVPWNRESSPSILMSITPLSVKVWECCSSSIYLKILGQPFLGWKLQRTLNKIYLK